jgi:PilZ domain
MQQSAQERRTMRRFDMRLPASVRVAGNGLGDLLTETQNVSARGVFFYLDRHLAEGTRIEVTMTFPPHVTLTEPVRVRFTARVVRVEDSPSVSSIGVAAMIEEYEFLRSNSAAEFSSGMR